MRTKVLAAKIASILFVCLLLTACNAFAQNTPEPLPTVVLDDNTSTDSSSFPMDGVGVIASGVVAPARQAQVAAAMSGSVSAVEAAVGDRVQAGQVLVSLAGSEKFAAAVESARFELLTAQQALADLDKDMDVRRAQALKTIADNQDMIRDAEQYLLNIQTQSEQVDIDAAYANMILARDKLDKARDDYGPYENKVETNVVRAGLLSRLAQAQKDYDALVRRYNNLIGTASEIDVDQAQASLAIALAQLAKSQRDYEILQNGPDPDAVRLAEARQTTAQAQLTAAESALKDLELQAPFDGTITSLDIQVNEWVTPGQPVLVVSDLENLRVETTDLSERDVPQIQLGQAVTVEIEALALEITGSVLQIAPLADILGGDVVYKTTIQLEAPPSELRAGMSVEVRFSLQPSP
jgi:multidrug efflux pump subunit AcrA (membrane-fusion protein)